MTSSFIPYHANYKHQTENDQVTNFKPQKHEKANKLKGVRYNKNKIPLTIDSQKVTKMNYNGKCLYIPISTHHR